MQQLVFLYNKINVTLYIFQHTLYNNLSLYYDSFNLLKLFSLLFIGIFTSLTPCFISILPMILSSSTTLRPVNIFTKSTIFIGFMSSLILIIFIVYIGNGTFIRIANNIPVISSLFLIILALNLLGVTKISFFIDSLFFDQSIFKNIYINAYIIGFSLGLASLPCNSSLIFTTILWLYNSERILESFGYLFIYLFGCLLPFIIILLIPFEFLKFQKWINLWDLIIELGGGYMLTFAVFTFFQQLL